MHFNGGVTTVILAHHSNAAPELTLISTCDRPYQPYPLAKEPSNELFSLSEWSAPHGQLESSSFPA